MTTKTTTTGKAADKAETRKDFETLKRDFEKAIASGPDYAAALLELSTAISAACVNKCADPQRKTAAERDSVSNNGLNPVMMDLKRGIFHDMHLLENTQTNADKATRTTYNDAGDMVTETADAAALAAFGELIGETLTDGIDLVHTAAAALLEQAADHAAGENWLDTPYTVRRLAKKVYIRTEDSAAYREEEATPIQEVYRAVRRAIQSSRAVQTDPRNGYTYISDTTPDGLDAIYYRMGKYADIGGCAIAEHSKTPGSPALYPAGSTHYTADRETVLTYEKMLAALNLTRRQAEIVNLRMKGHGTKAISTYLGVTKAAVDIQLQRLRAKCEKMGFTPGMWAEMTAGEN